MADSHARLAALLQAASEARQESEGRGCRNHALRTLFELD
jgi:hypothetical protein